MVNKETTHVHLPFNFDIIGLPDISFSIKLSKCLFWCVRTVIWYFFHHNFMCIRANQVVSQKVRFCVCAVSQISDLNVRNTNKVVLILLCYTVLFGLYSNESDIHVVRDEFQKHLHICENGYIPDSIGALFNEVCFTLYLFWHNHNI